MSDSKSKIAFGVGGRIKGQEVAINTRVLPTSHMSVPMPPIRPAKSEGETVPATSATRPGKA